MSAGGQPGRLFADPMLAGGMAFLAGATDVCGLVRLRGLFVSFMSGNTTMLGVAIGHGDWARAGLVGGLVGLFVAGAAVGAALAVGAGSRHATVVMVAVAALLALAAVWPQAAVFCFVLAMGALNASMDHFGRAAVGLTYVTGTLVKLGQGLGRTLCGQPGEWTWLWQGPMWLSLLGGAVVAALVQDRLGETAVWPLPVLAALLACGTMLRSD